MKTPILIRETRHRVCLPAAILSLILGTMLVKGGVNDGWSFDSPADSAAIKTVWVRVPDVRYGKLNVSFPVPAQYADECKDVYFTGYTPGSDSCHAVQYLCANTLRGIEFYYFNDYSGNPQLLGICKGVPIGKYRYYKFINSRFIETDIDGLGHWIAFVQRTSDEDIKVTLHK
jgi:hypothetical protein